MKNDTPIFKKDQPDDSYKFQPLPAPSGNYPYHLQLQDIQPDVNHDKIVFHMVGDTGGVYKPEFQHLVAHAMAAQIDENQPNEDQPQFLYHLGDIVYHFGEAKFYNQQFFKPYAPYQRPIFAIAGNHDSDINYASEVPYHSLDAFTNVFCDTAQRVSILNQSGDRKTMIQPNVYWVLETPLANIIGLYTNVPKFGVITAEQRSWFVEQLVAANKDRPHKALIVCLHHSPYSADFNHGSSQPMIEFMEGVFEETNIKPDAVFSGHVHNYQRFNKVYPDGKTVPYIVSGAGGFDELHSLALKTDLRFTAESPLFNNVALQAYCDNLHGFLKITIEKNGAALRLNGEYYSIPAVDANPIIQLTDSFSIDIR